MRLSDRSGPRLGSGGEWGPWMRSISITILFALSVTLRSGGRCTMPRSIGGELPEQWRKKNFGPMGKGLSLGLLAAWALFVSAGSLEAHVPFRCDGAGPTCSMLL